MRPVPGAPRRARQYSRTGPCGYCRRILWVLGLRFQYSGKIRFVEKPGVQNEVGGGGRHVSKRSSDPRVVYPEVNFQVRDLVRIVGIVAIVGPFAPRGFSIRRKFVLLIGQAKSSIPALSYFQVGDMKHDQELYAKGSYIPSA